MTTPIIPKADEVRVMSRETRFMSPVVVTDPRTGKPIAVMKEDPEGRYVHWCDAYAQCSAPSPTVGGEVFDDAVVAVRTVHIDQLNASGYLHREEAEKVVRAALEAFVRGRGKS